MSGLAQALQSYGPWGVSAMLALACAALWRENRRLQQAVLDEAHATTELANKNNETWKVASDLLGEIRDSLARGQGRRA